MRPPAATLVGHLTAGRAQMGTSLAFHLTFAVLGVGLPLMMLIAEGLHLRTGDPQVNRIPRLAERKDPLPPLASGLVVLAAASPWVFEFTASHAAVAPWVLGYSSFGPAAWGADMLLGAVLAAISWQAGTPRRMDARDAVRAVSRRESGPVQQRRDARPADSHYTVS